MLPKLEDKAFSANSHATCVWNTIRILIKPHLRLANKLAVSVIIDRQMHRMTTVTLTHVPRVTLRTLVYGY